MFWFLFGFLLGGFAGIFLMTILQNADENDKM